MSVAAPTPMTAAAYLAWESAQLEKHEFHDGEIFAMSGATPRHVFLSGAFVGELRAALRGRGCGVFPSDLKVTLVPSRRYVYPDVTVVCGPMKHDGTSQVATNPRLIVEVLSKSTEAYDRGEKWRGYQGIASLTDYLLVDQQTIRVEHYHREDGGAWQYRSLGEGDRIALPHEASVAVSAIYDGALDYPSD